MDFEKELAELQDALANVDFYAEIQRSKENRSARGEVLSYLMVKELKPIKIKMDGNKNHKLPHVHIEYGRNFHAASYAIETGKRIVGDGRYDREVGPWIVKHRVKLSQAWDLMQSGQNAEPIAYELRAK